MSLSSVAAPRVCLCGFEKKGVRPSLLFIHSRDSICTEVGLDTENMEGTCRSKFRYKLNWNIEFNCQAFININHASAIVIRTCLISGAEHVFLSTLAVQMVLRVHVPRGGDNQFR